MRWLLPWLLLAAGVLTMPAHAATNCTIANATLALGTVSSGQVDTTTTLTITCRSSGLRALTEVKITFCLGLGTGTDGLSGSRQLTNTTADTLNYQAYSDSGRTLVFGTSSTSSPTWVQQQFSYPSILWAGNGSSTVTVYGRYPASQVLTFGAYTSPLAVSLQYAYTEPVLMGFAPQPSSCTQSTSVIQTSGLISYAATLIATANVAASCGTYTKTDMDFGSNVGAITSPIDRTSTISLTCVNRSPWQIGLNNGIHADVNGIRRMLLTIGANNYYIPYELYLDSGRTEPWGDTLNFNTRSGSGTGTTQPFTVYGRALATTAQATAPGAYSDIVTITITY